MPINTPPVCEDFFEEDAEKGFYIFVPAQLSSSTPLEKITELCPLLIGEPPCRYQEDICQQPKNNYHLCVNYRRHIREKLLENFRKAEKEKTEKKDEHGFYK